MKRSGHYVGKQIKNYQVNELLAQGGIGEVYLGEHPAIGRQVVIKVIDDALSEQPEVYDQFLEAVKTITTIDHPNIIKIYDFGCTEQGNLYYITEQLKGETLHERLQLCGRMTLEEVCPYVKQICAGLRAAHDSGVLHRELKPGIIFIQDSDQLKIKILDFGVAKVLDIEPRGLARTAKGIVISAPLTISPEQAAGHHDQLTPQTDLYSLGVILYWMLAGHPPFHEGPPAVILAQHITDPPPPLQRLVPGTPAAVAEVIHRCLEKAPGKRPRSAAEVADAFPQKEGAAPPVRIPGAGGRNEALSDTLPPVDPAELRPKKVTTRPLAAVADDNVDAVVVVGPAGGEDAGPPAGTAIEGTVGSGPHLSLETGSDLIEYHLPSDSAIHPKPWGAPARAVRDADGVLVPRSDDAPPAWRRAGWIALFIAVGVVAACLVLYALA